MGGGLRWSADQLAEHLARRAGKPAADPVVAAPKPSKHRNVRTERDGEKYDSKAEAGRHAELLRMERAGVITNLRRQVSFELAPGVKLEGRSRKSPPLRYFADYVYERDGATVIEDVKGRDKVTEGYRIKRHLMALLGHRIVEVRKGTAK